MDGGVFCEERKKKKLKSRRKEGRKACMYGMERCICSLIRSSKWVGCELLRLRGLDKVTAFARCLWTFG